MKLKNIIWRSGWLFLFFFVTVVYSLINVQNASSVSVTALTDGIYTLQLDDFQVDKLGCNRDGTAKINLSWNIWLDNGILAEATTTAQENATTTLQRKEEVQSWGEAVDLKLDIILINEEFDDDIEEYNKYSNEGLVGDDEIDISINYDYRLKIEYAGSVEYLSSDSGGDYVVSLPVDGGNSQKYCALDFEVVADCNSDGVPVFKFDIDNNVAVDGEFLILEKITTKTDYTPRHTANLESLTSTTTERVVSEIFHKTQEKEYDVFDTMINVVDGVIYKDISFYLQLTDELDGTAVYSSVSKTSFFPVCKPKLSVAPICDGNILGNSLANITWNPVIGADRYYIEREENGNADLVDISTTTTNINFSLCEDMTPSGNKILCNDDYKITTYFTEGGFRVDFLSVAGVYGCDQDSPPGTFDMVSVENEPCFEGTASIKVEWTSSENSIEYQVFRTNLDSAQEKDIGIVIGDTKIVDFNIDTGVNYEYRIIASGYSLPDQVTIPSMQNLELSKNCAPASRPSLGADTYCSSGQSYIDLNWDSVANEHSYTLYRDPEFVVNSNPDIINEFVLDIDSYLDSDINESQGIYEYKLIALGEGGNSDPDIYSISPEICDPSSVNIPILANGCNLVDNLPTVNISWYSSAKNTQHYDVYRVGDAIPICTGVDINNQVCVDSNVLNPLLHETSYTYKVVGVGYDGREEASISAPIVTNDCLPPEQPALIVGSPTCFNNGPYPEIDFSWVPTAHTRAYKIIQTELDGLNNPVSSVDILNVNSGTFNSYSHRGRGGVRRGEYANFDSLDDLNFPQSSGTVEFWFNNIYSDRWYRLFSKHDVLGSNIGILKYHDSGLRLYVRNNGDYIVSDKRLYDVFSNKFWNHILFSYDENGFFDLYINGVRHFHIDIPSITTAVGRTWELSNQQVYFGDDFNGLMDEIRIYDRQISEGEVLEHYDRMYNNNQGLVAYYNFDENENNGTSPYVPNDVIYDYSGPYNYYTGSPLNTVWEDYNLGYNLKPGANYQYQLVSIGHTDVLSLITLPINIINCRPVTPVIGRHQEEASVPGNYPVQCIPGDSDKKALTTIWWHSPYNVDNYELLRMTGHVANTCPSGDIGWDVVVITADASINEFVDNNDSNNFDSVIETDYTYKVKASNTAGDSYSTCFEVTIPVCAGPQPVTNPEVEESCTDAGDTGYKEITLWWEPTANTEYYRIYRDDISLGTVGIYDVYDVDCTYSYSGNPLFTCMFSDLHDEVNDLMVNTPYKYFIEAIGPGGVSARTPLEITTTYCNPSAINLNLTTGCLNQSPEINYTFNDNFHFNAVEYTYDYSIDDGGTWVNILNPLADPAASTVSGYLEPIFGVPFSPEIIYTFRAVSQKQPSAPGADAVSNNFKITTLSCGPPDAPTGLHVVANPTCTAKNLFEKKLDWDDMSGAYSYDVVRTDDHGGIFTSSVGFSEFVDRGDLVYNRMMEDYLRTENNFPLASDEITVSMWMKYNSPYVTPTTVYTPAREGTYIMYKVNSFYFYQNDNLSTYFRVRWGTGYNGWRESSSGYQIANRDEWHHYVGVYSASDRIVRLYIDGGQVSESDPYSYDPNIDFTVQNSSEILRFYHMGEDYNDYRDDVLLNDVRVYDRALADSEVNDLFQRIYKDESGLVASWSFDNFESNHIYDISKNSNTLILTSDDSFDIPYFVNYKTALETGFPDARPLLEDGYNYTYEIISVGAGIVGGSATEGLINISGECPDSSSINTDVHIERECITNYGNVTRKPVNFIRWSNPSGLHEYVSKYVVNNVTDSLNEAEVNPYEIVNHTGHLKHWLMLGFFDSVNVANMDDTAYLGSDKEIFIDGEPDQIKMTPMPGDLVQYSGNDYYWDEQYFSQKMLNGKYDNYDGSNNFGDEVIDINDYWCVKNGGSGGYPCFKNGYKSNSVVYASTYFYSPNEYLNSAPTMPYAGLKYFNDDQIKIFLNGELVVNDSIHSDSETLVTGLHFKQGINTIMVKVRNDGSGFDFGIRPVYFDVEGTSATDDLVVWPSSTSENVSTNYAVTTYGLLGNKGATSNATSGTRNCKPSDITPSIFPDCEHDTGKITLILDWPYTEEEEDYTNYWTLFMERESDGFVSLETGISSNYYDLPECSDTLNGVACRDEAGSLIKYRKVNLDSQTNYHFRLEAFYNDGVTMEENCSTVTELTGECFQYPVEPIVAVEPGCLIGDDSRVKLDISGINAATIKLDVYRRLLTDTEDTHVGPATLANSTIFFDNNITIDGVDLASDADYVYSVVASGQLGNAATTTVDVKTLKCADLPPQEVDLTTVNYAYMSVPNYPVSYFKGQPSISVNWSHSPNATGYTVTYAEKINGVMPVDGDYSVLGSYPQSQLNDSYAVNFDDDKSYVLKLEAVNLNGSTIVLWNSLNIPIAHPGDFVLDDPIWEGSEENPEVHLSWGIPEMTTIAKLDPMDPIYDGSQINCPGADGVIYKIYRTKIPMSEYDLYVAEKAGQVGIAFTNIAQPGKTTCDRFVIDTEPNPSHRYYIIRATGRANRENSENQGAEYYTCSSQGILQFKLPRWEEVAPE